MIKKRWLIYTLIFIVGFLANAILFQNSINIDVNISDNKDSAQEVISNEDTAQEPSTQETLSNQTNRRLEISKITRAELKDIVEESFQSNFHKVGNQAPVEYAGSYMANGPGSSFEFWLKPSMNYLTMNALLIDDTENSVNISYDKVKDVLLTFIPEVYDLKEKGIYVIDNDGVIYVYIKTGSDNFRPYVDYIFTDTDVEIPSYKFLSASENAEYVLKEPVFEIYPVENFYFDAIKKGSVFNGFFYNIDHSNPSVFLKNGPQTLNNYYQDVLNQFNDKKDLSTLMQIFKYISEGEYHFQDGEKFARTVDDIMESKMLTGCTDYGLLFASLARDKKIPTVFLQTARADWIFDRVRDDDNGITGHILIEVYIDGKWRLVDSTAGRYYHDYDINNFSLNDGYYVFSKSIEVLDSTISDEQENSIIMRDLFKNFNLEAYVDPLYDYVELSTGAKKKATPFVYGQQTIVQASDAN